MEKPITVRMDEYREEIVAVMNGSGLPAWLQVQLLEPLLTQLRALAAEEAERERTEWKESKKDGD